MVTVEQMRECEGKYVEITYNDGEMIEFFCDEYVQADDEGDEPMLFVPKNLAVLQSEIKRLEILE